MFTEWSGFCWRPFTSDLLADSHAEIHLVSLIDSKTLSRVWHDGSASKLSSFGFEVARILGVLFPQYANQSHPSRRGFASITAYVCWCFPGLHTYAHLFLSIHYWFPYSNLQSNSLVYRCYHCPLFFFLFYWSPNHDLIVFGCFWSSAIRCLWLYWPCLVQCFQDYSLISRMKF